MHHLLTNCISKINNTQVDDVHDIDVVRLIYNLITYSDNYSLWQYCRNEPALTDNAIIDFNVDNATTDLFKIKEKIIGQTVNNSIKYVEIMVLLKRLSNFLKLLKCI